ncbi:MAG: hypothetical protein GWN07_01620, partial [Actinobacteria bacterium]|nr:hypothetical protein [Actinomycetota bacterium]
MLQLHDARPSDEAVTHDLRVLPDGSGYAATERWTDGQGSAEVVRFTDAGELEEAFSRSGSARAPDWA